MKKDIEKIPKGFEMAVWIKPMVCTVAYMQTGREELRQAVFKCIRNDKMPEECRVDDKN